MNATMMGISGLWPLYSLCRSSSLITGAFRFFSTEPRVAIVGSGPAGFYLAQNLLRRGPEDLQVDVFERLPAPFGLVRYGIAPDHPEAKNVDNTFNKVAHHPRFRFVGKVSVGSDIKVTELCQAYHAVTLAYGAAKDRHLHVPGEDLGNVLSARSFVGFYNGLPEASALNISLDRHENAVVVGLGNVALDVARILLTPVDVLRKTDITETALERLLSSKIRRVYVVGRRGPLHVSFTIKEFREMLRLPDCAAHLNPLDYSGLSEALPKLQRPRKRLAELLVRSAAAPPFNNPSTKEWHLKLLRTPVEITPNADGDCVGGIRLTVNRLIGTQWSEDQGVESSEETELLECGLVLRSIGYKSIPLEASVPYDEKRGIVPNNGGRVVGRSGLYCAGWLATGPRGVIADTMAEAFRVAQNIIDDLPGLCDTKKDGYESVSELFKTRGVQPVSYEDWEKIDEREKQLGKASGKPREKMTNIDNMVSVLKE